MACRVLVVDDDGSILETIAEALALEGYEVATAKDGAEGIEQLERHRSMVVLLDMRMPVMDGWEFAREVRRRGIETQIVAMTAAQNAGSWAAEIGASSHLEKPFDLMELLDLVADRCAAAA